MLEAIILYMNTKLRVLFPDFELKGLCELVKDDEKDFVAPGFYCSDGNYEHIDFDKHKGLVYYRKNGDVSVSKLDESTTPTCDIYESHTFPMKLVLYGPKDIYGKMPDDAHIDDKLANNVKKAIQTSNDKTLNQTLKSSLASILVTDYTTDRNTVIGTEYQGAGAEVKVGFDKALISLDIEVKIEGKLSCFDYYGCDDEPVSPVFCDPVTIVNSEGDELGVAASGSEFIVGDSNIQNSNGTYNENVPAEDALVLPDIILTDYDGTQSAKPSVINVAATQLARTYAFPQPTGQTTIFRTGDDAWVQQNIFNSLARGYIIPLVNFFTLAENNVFGNTNRFTDHLGGQSYSASYMIDNYTGLGWYLVVPGQTSWNNQIDAALALSLTIGANTYDDWFMPNLHQMTSLYNKGMSHSLNYAPFNISIATGFRTSTTVPNATSNSYGILTNPFGSSQFSKAGNDPIIYCRKHF